MNIPIPREKGFLTTALTGLLLITIMLVIEFKKTWFVPATGNLKFLGSGIWEILVILLLLKWKNIRMILEFLVLLFMFIAIALMLQRGQGYYLSYSILLVALGSAFFLLRSEAVRGYVNHR